MQMQMLGGEEREDDWPVIRAIVIIITKVCYCPH